MIFDFNTVSSKPLTATVSQILAAQSTLQALSLTATANFPNGPPSLLPPGGLPGTQNTAGPLFASEFSQPYSIQMNIGVQRLIGKNLLLQADYVRNRGLHTFLVRDYNRVGAADTLNRATAQGAIAATLAQFMATSVNQAIASGATIQDFTNNGLGGGSAFPGINPGFGNLSLITTAGLSTYRGLLVKVTGRTDRFARIFRSMSWGVSYALSRFEATQADQAFASGVVNNNDCLTCLFGPVNVDRTHQLTINSLVELPLGLRWCTIARIGTGVPVTLRLNQTVGGSGEIFLTDINGDGRGGDVFPDTNLGAFGRTIKGADELNDAIIAFNQNFAGTLTPAGKELVKAGLLTESQLKALGATIPEIPLAPSDQVSIDSFLTADFRISKMFRIKERVQIEPSADIFNVFNIANFDPPPGITTGPLSGRLSGNPGTVNGTSPGARTNKFGLGAGAFSPGIPRSFQFGLRVTF
jgi:hypothetical protein